MNTEPCLISISCERAAPRTSATCARTVRLPWNLNAAGWLPLVMLPVASLVIRSQLPAWQFMWAMLFSVVAGCKWLTWCRPSVPSSGFWRSLAYLIAWPGMDAARFLSAGRAVARPGRGEWMTAWLKLTVGVLLVVIALERIPTGDSLAAGWFGMVGFAFLLHFGTFHLLSLCYRAIGIDAAHIFQAPALARSVSDFWGSRWNLAFRDLAHSYVFRPLAGKLGSFGASLAVFAVSGLVHELVISLPAGAGYGLPTIYFSIQWLGLVVQKSSLCVRFGLHHGLAGRAFAFAVVVAPMGLLFHPPFVVLVMVPFLKGIEEVRCILWNC